jgi:hypothetical protein
MHFLLSVLRLRLRSRFARVICAMMAAMADGSQINNDEPPRTELNYLRGEQRKQIDMLIIHASMPYHPGNSLLYNRIHFEFCWITEVCSQMVAK